MTWKAFCHTVSSLCFRVQVKLICLYLLQLLVAQVVFFFSNLAVLSADVMLRIKMTFFFAKFWLKHTDLSFRSFYKLKKEMSCVCVVSFLYNSHSCHSPAGGWWSLWDWSEPIWPEEATMGCTTPSRSLWSSFRLVLFWRWAWRVAASCSATYLLHFEGIRCSLTPFVGPVSCPGSHEMADKPHFLRGCDWFKKVKSHYWALLGIISSLNR